jgi:hypothetical protein
LYIIQAGTEIHDYLLLSENVLAYFVSSIRESDERIKCGECKKYSAVFSENHANVLCGREKRPYRKGFRISGGLTRGGDSDNV